MAEFHIKTSENGKLQGPFSSGQLKKLAGQGKLRPEHLVSANGGASWHSATRVSGLEFPSPASSSQTPPPFPQDNSPGPKKLPIWVIVGAASGVLCLVGICGCMGLLMTAGGSGEPTGGETATNATDASTDTSLSDTTTPSLSLSRKQHSPRLIPLNDLGILPRDSGIAGKARLRRLRQPFFLPVEHSGTATTRGKPDTSTVFLIKNRPQDYVGHWIRIETLAFYPDPFFVGYNPFVEDPHSNTCHFDVIEDTYLKGKTSSYALSTERCLQGTFKEQDNGFSFKKYEVMETELDKLPKIDRDNFVRGLEKNPHISFVISRQFGKRLWSAYQRIPRDRANSLPYLTIEGQVRKLRNRVGSYAFVVHRIKVGSADRFGGVDRDDRNLDLLISRER